VRGGKDGKRRARHRSSRTTGRVPAERVETGVEALEDVIDPHVIGCRRIADQLRPGSSQEALGGPRTTVVEVDAGRRDLDEALDRGRGAATPHPRPLERAVGRVVRAPCEQLDPAHDIRVRRSTVRTYPVIP